MSQAAERVEFGTRILDISGSNYQDIPDDFTSSSCRSCIYWEMGDSDSSSSCGSRTDPEVLKRIWFNSTGTVFGPSGKLVYHNGKVVAWAQYAPASCFPNARTYRAQPSEDAYLITCLVVAPKYRRRGFGEMLLRAIVEDLRGRGLKAVETFARKNSENNPSGPIELYQRVGFKVQADDENFPFLRLELNQASVAALLESVCRI